MEIFKNKRLLVKSFGWEFLAFILAVFFYWIWFGNFTQSLLASIAFTFIKSFGLYYYLKLWKTTKWGKENNTTKG